MSKPVSELVDERTRAEPDVAHQFVDIDQQHFAAELGMWLFLATEIMFFGAFFLAYFVYRDWYPIAFAMGSRQMDVLLGTVNTGVLLTSSLTMALAVRASERSQRHWLIGWLLTTFMLGTLFLGIKGLEYDHKYAEQLVPLAGWNFAPTGDQRTGMREFFNLYFLMTGLHALHMVAGLMMLAWLVLLACRKRGRNVKPIVVHNVGLYWHFVDLVWVYLFPFFYLVSIVR